MTKMNKILCSLLFTISLITAGSILYLRYETTSLDTDISVLDRRMQAAIEAPEEKERFEIDSWFDYINTEKPRFHEANVDDGIYGIGQEISLKIKRQNLQIEFYNILDKENRKYFNYTLTGNIYNCLKFVQSLSVSDKYYLIDTISIEKNADKTTMTILFTPAVIRELEEASEAVQLRIAPKVSVSPGFIDSKLFYTPQVKIVQETEPAAPEPVIEKKKYIGECSSLAELYRTQH